MRRARAPRLWRLGLARGAVELRSFVRDRAEVVATFGLPVLLLVLLGSIFHQQMDLVEVNGTAVTAGMAYTAGLIALSVGSAAFVNLGVGVAIDRDDGTLARLRAVPAPPAAYLIGKIIMMAVTALTGACLLIVTGRLLFDLPLPTDPWRWVTFGWVFLLGATACAALGLAVSNLAGSPRGAGAVMNLPFLALSFMSGILVPISVVPDGLATIGALFPFLWMAQGFRSVFLPDEMAAFELTGAWEHGRIAAVLAVWCIGGLLLCLKTFRWRNRRDG